MTTILHKPS